MTGSWDQTLKFWDTRSPNPMLVLQIPERVYCADVVYPMAIVGTAQRGIICYQLENQPSEYKRIESPLKYQVLTSHFYCQFRYRAWQDFHQEGNWFPYSGKPIWTELVLKKSVALDGQTIVNRGSWLWSPANIKGANKDAKNYVGRSTTLHNLLFCAHTLWMNYVTSMFLLVSPSVRSKQLLCFVQGQCQKSEQWHTTKNIDEFHNHSHLLTVVKLAGKNDPHNQSICFWGTRKWPLYRGLTMLQDFWTSLRQEKTVEKGQGFVKCKTWP